VGGCGAAVPGGGGCLRERRRDGPGAFIECGLADRTPESPLHLRYANTKHENTNLGSADRIGTFFFSSLLLSSLELSGVGAVGGRRAAVPSGGGCLRERRRDGSGVERESCSLLSRLDMSDTRIYAP